MAEGITVVKNTARKYLKGAVDQTVRGRFWLAYLKNHGRIKLGDKAGTSRFWNVTARQPEVRQHGDGGQQTFAEHDAYEQLEIDVRGYISTDLLSHKKALMNSEPLAIVDLYGTKLETLMRSVSDSLGRELYIDGNAAGNGNRFHGVQSFTANDGATVAADLVANPSDTYAGKSTALANLGGNWTSDLGAGNYPNATIAKDWPAGSGDSHYDYLAPKLINYSSTGWATGGTTWRDNCSICMRRAKVWCQSLSGFDATPMCFLLSSQLYAEFEDYMETKFRILIPHKESQDLGFDDGLNFGGSIVKHDFHCPANMGYGINANEMQLFTLTEDLLYSEGPEWDIKSQAYLYLVGVWGNLRFNPKHFAELKNYA